MSNKEAEGCQAKLEERRQGRTQGETKLKKETEEEG